MTTETPYRNSTGILDYSTVANLANGFLNDCHLDISKTELPLLLLLTLIFNAVAMLVLVQIRSKSNGIDSLLVLTLATNDFVTTLLYTVMWIGGWIACGSLMERKSCSLLGWLSTALVIWSAWIIIIMSCVRYLATVKPVYYKTKVTTSRIKIGLVLTLLHSLSLVMFPFFKVAAPYFYYKFNRICAYDFAPGKGGPAHRTILGVMAVEGLLTILMVLFFNVSTIYQVSRIIFLNDDRPICY